MRNPFNILGQRIDNTFSSKKIDEDVKKGKMEQGSIVWFFRQVGSFIRHIGSVFVDGVGARLERTAEKKKGEIKK